MSLSNVNLRLPDKKFRLGYIGLLVPVTMNVDIANRNMATGRNIVIQELICPKTNMPNNNPKMGRKKDDTRLGPSFGFPW
ncbi:hypothetical protein DSCW_12810 [Desulfosarcina widdelii]|uniref:Uncharacterized protein n=1 Tax=Desulfosarcina widdelii TaxID=947919 RepID=A0A5K7Z603_9BACT|nr:hypothetical protein [Desulfosarcina widdelii]BBO73864.1 hypothetical protein DSCW_12810 [Desulfosarcina widdelii]